MLGRNYINPVIHSLPANTPFPVEPSEVLNLADIVFNRLKRPDAMSTLSLPRPADYPWPEPSASFDLIFIKAPAGTRIRNVAPSSTQIINGILTCEVNYCDQELACSQLMISRTVHELTHAIRRSLIVSIHSAYPHTLSLFTTSTPAKPLRHRSISTKLVKMNVKEEFDSGFWIQHKLFNGCIVSFVGTYYTNTQDQHQVTASEDSPAFYKLREIKVGCNRDGDYYKRFKGDLYSTSTGKFHRNVDIYFAGVTSLDSHRLNWGI